MTKPLTDKEKQQRRRVSSRKRNAAKSVTNSYAIRFAAERKPHGMMAVARVVDNKRQRATVYLLDEDDAQRLAVDLNHLEEFKTIMKNALTMREIVDVMLAIEAADDLPALTKACDQNRELLFRLKVGPFKRTSHTKELTDEENAASQEEDALAARNAPTGAERDVEEEDEDGQWHVVTEGTI